MKFHFFTIAACNYLAQVATLKSSLDAAHPEIDFTVFLCDELGDVALPAPLKNADIVPLSTTGLPHYADMALRYDILELSTAVKPFCFLYLAQARGADFSVYFDPDMLLVSPLRELLAIARDGAQIVLTPHTSAPVEDKLKLNDHDLAKAGIYNLGFCGAASTGEGKRFVAWWARKLIDDCRVDIENGIFVDQKWCDAVPALFDDVHILKHDGYNVGYWNFAHRPLWWSDSAALMAGRHEARLLHFSGVDMSDAKSVSKHQDRFNTANLNEATRSALLAYRFQLIANSYFQLRSRKPSLPVHRHFKDDAHNSLYWKTFSRCRPAASPLLASTEDFVSYELWLNGPRQHVPVPNFLLVLLTMRPDLATMMGDGTAAERLKRLLDWAGTRLPAEMPLEPQSAALLQRSVSALRTTIAIRDGRETPDPAVPRALQSAFGALSFVELPELFRAVYSLHGDFGLGAPAPADGACVPLFLQMLQLARADLARDHDLSTREGRLGLLRWAVQHFAEEYGSSAAIEALLKHVRDDVDGWPGRYPAQSPRAPAAAPAAMSGEQWNRAINHGWVSPPDYPIWAGQRGGGQPEQVKGAAARAWLPPLEDRATLVGYVRAQNGMGEFVRSTAAALSKSTVDFELFDFNVNLNCALTNNEFADLAAVRPSGRVNILHINADQTIVADRVLGDALFKGRYNVGYWMWELEKFPNEWLPAVDRIDEIWAATDFIARSLRQVTDKPIIRMPMGVEPVQGAHFDLKLIGIAPDEFCFLFFFDFDSFYSRKNPRAVIEAFTAAFPLGGPEKVRLIIKTIGRQGDPRARRELDECIARDPRLVQINGVLDPQRMFGLIAGADCFVSLHRSEGFGRGMAEAMVAGRPVIATGYGGNMDFMTEDNSFLVDYRLIPLQPGDYPLSAGAVWADPSVSHAAELMRRVHDDRDEAARRALLGKTTIETNHSSARVAECVETRLKELGLSGTAGGRADDSDRSTSRRKAQAN